MVHDQIKPGQRIRLIQEIDRREGNWRHELSGVVLSAHPEPTGSWYARAPADKLWLNRIRLQKEDGEITTVVVDLHTRVEVLSDPPATS